MKILRKSLAVSVVTLFLAGTANAQNLKIQKFPDGTGQIGVAAGWKLADGGSGGAKLAGPSGAGMALGQMQFVLAHNYDQMTLTPGVNPEIPRVHLNDPVVATVEMLNLLQRVGGLKSVKIKAVERVPGFGMPAAFLRYSATLQGKPMEFYGFYQLAQTDQQSGMYYYSVVMAPPGVYAKQLPVMNAMWKSWSLSPKAVHERLDTASKIIGEVDIPSNVDGGMQKRRLSALQSAREFQKMIRGDKQ